MTTPAAQRKVWVRRPGASATLVAFNETDVVDDVREMLLRKYGNSLGRVYDAPDVTLRLCPREAHQGERTLGPDELMTRTLDVYYPGGQTIEEALVIDVPIRRATPNASPRGGPPHAYHLTAVHHERGARGVGGDHRGDYSSHSAMVPDYFGPGVVPDYYNHGALTAESEYSQATLAPESALTGPGGARGGGGAGSQHLYPPSPGHLHPTHKGGIVRSPTGGAGSGVSAAALQGVPGVGGAGGGGGSAGNSPLNHPHSISILATGQPPPLPSLPSPGGSSRRSHKERPKIHRQLSSVPDDGTGNGREGSSSQINGSGANGIPGQKGLTASGLKIPIAAPIPAKGGSGRSSIADGLNQKVKGTPDVNGGGIDKDGGKNGVNGTTNGGSGATSARSVASPPRPMSPMRGKRAKKSARSNGSGLLNGSSNNADDSHNNGSNTVQLGPLTVPPINVLIVEDNIINLKLLEAFVKRLKVRWQTAMNGRDAVTKWRTGGFHLVLMDIQLPLMSGLDATREIRRLERVNSIGVFASTPSDSIGVGRDPQSDKLANLALFKSPVIIVALTASSLQSDRNDALAAGCNDFLTKPVNFLWLEKKIMEWGCMQALIDFDGWRKWKEQKTPAPASSSSQSAHGHSAHSTHASHANNNSGSGGGNNDNNGSSDATSSKKFKKSSGHNKRPSMSITNNGESSETTNTVSSAESPGPSHTRNNSGSVSARSPGQSPLAKPSISERLAAATAAVEGDNAAMDEDLPEKKDKSKK